MDKEKQPHSGIELDHLDLPDLPELEEEDEPFERDSDAALLEGILESLDREMKAGKFLHTFTAQIIEINEIVRMEYASSRDIAQVILKDVSVASKVLSLVNSAYYSRFGKEGIASIAEAMVILGTEIVQQTASTLLLFEFMQDMGKGGMLKEKSLMSLMRNIMGREIAETAGYPEKDAFQLVSMLYDIGEQVVIFCKPEVYQRIEHFAVREDLDGETVSKKMLGVSFSEIGRGIALGWGFPKSIVEGLYPFEDFDRKEKHLSLRDLKRLVASFTHEMCSMDEPMDRAGRRKKIEEIVGRYGRFLAMTTEDAEGLLDHALAKMTSHARTLKIRLKDTRFDMDRSRTGAEAVALGIPERSGEGLGHLGVQEAWVKGRIAAIEKALEAEFRLSDILLQVITTIYKGFFFSRIAICILDKANGIMTPRFVLGDDMADFGKNFRFQVQTSGGDVFNKALNTGLDMLVEDMENREWNSRIPDWFTEGAFAPCFALYPLLVEKKKVGLIYVDWSREFTPLFSNEVKIFMQQLKGLTLMAIRKSRG